eukprot:371842-Rhodomonas_salina.1
MSYSLRHGHASLTILFDLPVGAVDTSLSAWRHHPPHQNQTKHPMPNDLQETMYHVYQECRFLQWVSGNATFGDKTRSLTFAQITVLDQSFANRNARLQSLRVGAPRVRSARICTPLALSQFPIEEAQC